AERLLFAASHAHLNPTKPTVRPIAVDLESDFPMPALPLPASRRRWPICQPRLPGLLRVVAEVARDDVESRPAADRLPGLEVHRGVPIEPGPTRGEPGIDPRPVVADEALHVDARQNAPSCRPGPNRDGIVPARTETDRRHARIADHIEIGLIPERR